jgi:hypothetical protein
MGHFKWHRPIAAAGLFVVITLPFVGQAFHVDDPNFLALARHARPNPLKLYDFTINWGRVDERAFDILANPPFGPWYAALLLPIAQDREWIYHVGFWPFLVLALFGAYRLTKIRAGTAELDPDLDRRFAGGSAGFAYDHARRPSACILCQRSCARD